MSAENDAAAPAGNGRGGGEMGVGGARPHLYYSATPSTATHTEPAENADAADDAPPHPALTDAARSIALAPEHDRLVVFAAAANRLAALVRAGELDREAAVDRLRRAAGAYDLISMHGVGAVERRISVAFSDDDRPLDAISNHKLDAAMIARESGAAVLDAVEKFLARFVVYPSEHARVAHTLWIAHTHRMDAWFATPRLAFLSAEKESGKTRALEVTALLVPEPLLSFSISPAALVRKVATSNCTVLYDEIDALFGSAAREEGNLDVRSIINGGYRRGAVVYRCTTIGRRIEVESLNAFAPVALAGLRELPDTLGSRCIIIRMRRRAPDEHIEQWHERRVPAEGEALRRRIAGWIGGVDFADYDPEMPAVVTDRAAECWRPMLAVAAAAGRDWPRRAREAAVALVVASRTETTTPGVELLSHIREAFDEAGVDAMGTEDLLARLRDRPESPWRDIRGKPLDDRGLARRLRGFGIAPTVVRVGGRTPRGYRRADFIDAWRRYCDTTRVFPSQAQQAQQAQQSLKINDLTLRSPRSQAQQAQQGATGSVADAGTASATLSACNHSIVADVALVALGREQAAPDAVAAPAGADGAGSETQLIAHDLAELPGLLADGDDAEETRWATDF